jgi:hypothetical protein
LVSLPLPLPLLLLLPGHNAAIATTSRISST